MSCKANRRGTAALGGTKPVEPKRAVVRELAISRMEIHSGFCQASNGKVRFPPQSVSAERIRRPVSLRDACGHLLGRFGSAVMKLRAADLGTVFLSGSSARQAC